tara:strand:+ start:525 stop:1304 length:780 start_codon:yes stop_codon:yes gene_type:complete
MNKNIPKIIFIVPYRNRKNEKIHFSIYMKYLMEDYSKEDFEIYFSTQTDVRPFNRGGVKNIGFLAIKDKYPNDYKNMTFVFNDIDTMPFKKNTFNYKTEKNKVKHFYGFKFALGGIFSINGEDFENCLGFPNNWGWGLEDNAMLDRVVNNNIKIDRSEFYDIKSKEIIHLFDTPYRLINNSDPTNYDKKLLYDNIDKIHNLKFNIENDETNFFNIIITSFDTLLPYNHDKYYSKNISIDSKLRSNFIGKIENNRRWKMF